MVGGWLGSSVGWATAELGNQIYLQPANVLATIAAGLSAGSEIINGTTGINNTVTINSEGISMEGNAVYGPSFQTGPYLTVLGWQAPLSYLSAGLQYTAILADMGILSPPPIYAEARLELNFKKHNYEFNYRLTSEFE